MVTWTVPQHAGSDGPTFSLSGAIISWHDGDPAVVRQTEFSWREDAWQASVEITSLGRRPRHAFVTLRLSPSVAATWSRLRINPRRAAAAQLRDIVSGAPPDRDLGTLTLRA